MEVKIELVVLEVVVINEINNVDMSNWFEKYRKIVLL